MPSTDGFGRLVFNGNMGSIATFVDRVKPWILGARADGQPPRVLLVTAAWGQGEYDEAPLRAALNAIGVRSEWRDGFDRNIVNLCAWHAHQAMLAERAEVGAVARELGSVEEATRRFYVEKTAFHAGRLRDAVKYARERIGPDFSLGGLPVHEKDAVRPEATQAGLELLGRVLAREIGHELSDLVQNDRRMLASLAEAEASLAARTGLRLDPQWKKQQAILEQRILASDVILLPGGDPDLLLGALRFFDLKPALVEALRRGATFCSISAGSLVLCERVIVFDDFSPDPSRREFRLWNQGLGLVGGLQILPHCMDRIHTDDPNNLAYLARRFSSYVCAGLNEESFLLVEPSRSRATSVGEQDGVYVFGPEGVKRRYGAGEAIPIA